jgi:hypothetical protein
MKLRDSLAAGLLAAVCLAAPAYAQSNNGGTGNSNATGVINSNSTGVGSSSSPLSGSGGPGSGSAGYNSSTLAQAQSLQQQLAAAQSALDNFKPTPTGPRYFSRASQPCNCGDGGGQERAQLEANLAKAKADAAAFLESVRNPGRDKLGEAQSAGALVGPTW